MQWQQEDAPSAPGPGVEPGAEGYAAIPDAMQPQV